MIKTKNEVFFIIKRKAKTLTIKFQLINERNEINRKITEGIQEKGKNIVIADLTNIDDTICKYFCNLSRKLSQSGECYCRFN